MSIAFAAIGETPIAASPSSQPVPKVPPKRRKSAVADRTAIPEPR